MGKLCLGLSLKAVGDIYRVGEVHGTICNELLQESQEFVFIGIMQCSFSKRKELSCDDSVHHVPSQSAHGLSFCDDNDIFIFTKQDQSNSSTYHQMLNPPSLSLMMPKIPAMLETRFVPSRDPSLSRISPEGRSITNVGALGVEGEVKA